MSDEIGLSQEVVISLTLELWEQSQGKYRRGLSTNWTAVTRSVVSMMAYGGDWERHLPRDMYLNNLESF